MEIIRGTTPTIIIEIDEEAIDLAEVKELWLYISQSGSLKIDKSKANVSVDTEEKTISFRASQKETLSLEGGHAVIQLRLLLNDGTALATIGEKVEVKNVYKGGEIA